MLNWFNKIPGKRRVGRIITILLAKLDFCLLFVYYYLHYHQKNDTNLYWVEFPTKVNSKLIIEYQVSVILL